MKTFDFTQISNKYPLLKDKDVSFLNDFFNRADILTVISDVENKRKSGLLAIILAFIFTVIFTLFLIYFLSSLKYQNDGNGNLSIYIIGIVIMLYLGYYHYVITKFRSNIKKSILSKMIDNTDFGVKYSDNSNYFTDDLDNISKNTKIIKKFDKIDFKEDSIEINEQIKGYLITGMEFATSVKSTDNKGRTHYNRNNHGYLMKIKFYNPKFKITSPITLLTQKEINYRYIYWFLFVIVFIFFAIFKELLILFIGLVIYGFIYFTKKYQSKNIVKLENIEFEEKFNVYSEDDINTRKILTPSFMYRIYDYVNKINKGRKYDFYFKDDYIYINYKINNDYLEVTFFKSLYSNISDYVEFYLELKNISQLASDLKLSFYDKTFGLNNVIK